MNEHKSFDKCVDETLKRFLNFYVEVKKFVLLFIFIIFKQFRQRANDACVKFYKTFIKICESQEHLKFFQCF